MKIGQWVRRKGQRWHRVESIVAGDAITRCGRRMDRVTASGGELEVSAVMPLTRLPGQPQNCRQCDPHRGQMPGATAPEDDASTWTDP